MRAGKAFFAAYSGAALTESSSGMRKAYRAFTGSRRIAAGTGVLKESTCVVAN